MDAQHHVAEVMTYPVVAVQPGVAAGEVARQLAWYRIGAVPVVDSSLHVLGVLAESDLLADNRSEWVTAGDLMSSPAFAVTERTTVEEARAVLVSRGIGRLPVVDQDRRLVGIVSRRDLLLSGLPSDNRIKRQVIDRAIDTGAVVEHVQVRDGVVRVHARVARRSEVHVLEHLLRRVPGVVRLRAHIDFDLDDVAVAVADGAVRDDAT